MASLDGSPSLFAGKTWSEWATHVPSESLDDPGGTRPVEHSSDECGSMRLRKEDMALFGFCPARDEFYLVICEICNQVIKPQAFRKHLELRHEEKIISTKSSSHSSSSSHLPLPAQGSTSAAFKTGPSVPTKASVKQPPPSFSQSSQSKMGSIHNKLKADENKLNKNHMPVVEMERMPSHHLHLHHHHHSEANVGVKTPLTNGTMKSASNTSTPIPTPPTPSTPVSHVTPPTAISSTTVVMTSTATTTTASITTMATSTASMTSTMSVTPSLNTTSVISSSFSTKKFPHMDKIIPCKDREYDANKHCGVLLPEIGKACTRSLTCKTHALSLRRHVQGRRLPFDELLKEHKEAKEIYLKAKAEHTANVKAAKVAAAAITSGGQHKPHNNAVVLSRPLLANELQTHRDLTTRTKNANHSLSQQKTMPKPCVKSLNSLFHRPNPNSLHSPPLHIRDDPGGDSTSRVGGSPDGDGSDSNDYQYLSYHPRPAAMCSFGARRHSLNGSGGCYLFSRKTDYLRATFLSLLERHLNPPPPKKLCVESKLPKEPTFVSNSKDPYEFNMVDATINATHGFSTVLNSSNKGLAKPKPKPVSGGNRSKSKDSNMDSRSPGQSSGCSSNNCAVKRKRNSGSTGVDTSSVTPSSVSIPTTNLVTGISTLTSQTITSPYHAITIPNINLGSAALSHFNANMSEGKQPKNNLIKDLEFVVTGFTDPILNGQFLNLTSAQITDFTRPQLSLDEKTFQNTQIVTGNTKTGYASKLHNLQALSVLQKNNLSQNTLIMDTSVQAGTVLAPVSIATSLSAPIVSLASTTMSPIQPSPSTTPSPFRSRSASPQVCSPLPNGVVPSPSDTNIINAHRHSIGQKIHKNIHPSHLSQPLISAGNPAQMCASQVFTAHPLTQRQVKPRNIAVAKVGNKFTVQPVSMTIPIISQPGLGAVVRQQPATHTLFITGEDPQKTEIQLQAHQVSSSPSGMIS